MREISKDEATRLDPLRFEIVYRAALDEVLGIDEAGLILVALLSGGDYDEVSSFPPSPLPPPLLPLTRTLTTTSL